MIDDLVEAELHAERDQFAVGEPSKLFLRSIWSLHHYKGMEHISDHDLERYHLGMVVDESELAPVEEHLLACPSCAERAEQAAEYVDTLRAAIVAGSFDLDYQVKKR